jgi:hypothetical protein
MPLCACVRERANARGSDAEGGLCVDGEKEGGLERSVWGTHAHTQTHTHTHTNTHTHTHNVSLPLHMSTQAMTLPPSPPSLSPPSFSPSTHKQDTNTPTHKSHTHTHIHTGTHPHTHHIHTQVVYSGPFKIFFPCNHFINKKKSFSGEAKDSAIFAFYFLLHKLHKPAPSPSVRPSAHS